MKKFLKHIFITLSASLIFFEIMLRVFQLTNDVPRRKIENNLQTYKPNQEGYYKGAKWMVNDFGFLGFDDTSGGNDQVLLVGDSYIENMMNNLQCHIGFYLKENNLKVFELARSGMTFIEYLEFIKLYTPKIKQAKTIVLVNNNDIYESISNFRRYSDRLQINLNKRKIENVKLNAPLLKSILYNIKSLYYLYYKGFLNFNIKKNVSHRIVEDDSLKNKLISDFFKIIESDYSLSEINFILFNVDKIISQNFIKTDARSIHFLSMEERDLREDDNHFTCLGNKKIANLIVNEIINK